MWSLSPGEAIVTSGEPNSQERSVQQVRLSEMHRKAPQGNQLSPPGVAPFVDGFAEVDEVVCCPLISNAAARNIYNESVKSSGHSSNHLPIAPAALKCLRSDQRGQYILPMSNGDLSDVLKQLSTPPSDPRGAATNHYLLQCQLCGAQGNTAAAIK